MKLTFKKEQKRFILFLTSKEFDALLAALDSVCYGEGRAYRDVYALQKKILKAILARKEK